MNKKYDKQGAFILEFTVDKHENWVFLGFSTHARENDPFLYNNLKSRIKKFDKTLLKHDGILRGFPIPSNFKKYFLPQ
jgi:hypothetical protein